MPRIPHASLLKGRENAKSLDLEKLSSIFVPWTGLAPFTEWPSEALSGTKAGAGETVSRPFTDIVQLLREYASGPPVPKGEGAVIAFGTSINGGSADADCDQVTWLFLDNDGAGDLNPLLDLFNDLDVAYIAQRRGVKWHLHLPLAAPITVPRPFDHEWKLEHVARMEWTTGVFAELAGLEMDLNAKKKIYGFDAAIPSIRVLGICYPYARRKEEDEVPETRWHEGRALDIDKLLTFTGFEYSRSTSTPRTVSRDEAQGRLKALMAADLVRRELDDGKAALVCPWSTDITKHGHEPGGETATVIFPTGVWYCAHETCRGRRWRDVDTWLADNKPAAREEAWRSRLLYNDKGLIKTSIHNALIIFENDPAWKGALRYDKLAQRIHLTREPPWQGNHEWSDAFITQAAGWLAREWGIEGQELTAKAIEAVASNHSFDPVKEYLSSLVWDGTSRIDTWLIEYLGAEDIPLNRLLGRLWLISACKRGYDPGSKVDHMIVLEGAQGLGKSSALRILGGPWYGEITTIHGTAAMENLSGMWILEMGELAATQKSETETLKSFLTKINDTYRGAYLRVVEHRPRRCVFAGTTNANTYLDDARNRRIWPVRVTKKLDQVAFEHVRDQLFAEAMVRLHAGEPWHIIDSQMEELVGEAQETRRSVTTWEEKIEAYLSGRTVATTQNVMGILSIEMKDQARYHKAVGRILQTLGWEAKKVRHGVTGVQGRYLVHMSTNPADIRWTDLGRPGAPGGGPPLTVLPGGKGATDPASPASDKTP